MLFLFHKYSIVTTAGDKAGGQMDLCLIQIMGCQSRFLLFFYPYIVEEWKYSASSVSSSRGRIVVLCRARKSTYLISLVRSWNHHCKSTLIILIAFMQNQKNPLVTVCILLGDSWVKIGTSACLLVQTMSIFALELSTCTGTISIAINEIRSWSIMLSCNKLRQGKIVVCLA